MNEEEMKQYIETLEKQVQELQKELDDIKRYESELFQGWHINDFYSHAREYYYPDLTREQCMIVGNYVNKYYDASVGISYDNLDFFIETAIEAKKINFVNGTYKYNTETIGLTEDQVVLWLKDNKDIHALLRKEMSGNKKTKAKAKK